MWDGYDSSLLRVVGVDQVARVLKEIMSFEFTVFV